MSTDRELLELAAKAAGVELVGPVEKFIVQFDERHKGGFIVRNDRGGDSAWNPLNDDGDALRLASSLGLSCQFTPYYSVCYAGSPMAEQFTEKAEVNRHAATRRAIVRAAAALGKVNQ